MSFISPIIWRLSFCCLLGGVAVSCVDAGQGGPSPVFIEETLPQPLFLGGTMSVVGGGFGIQGAFDRVYLSGQELEILYWTQTRIDCRLPLEVSGAKVVIVQSDRFITKPHEVMIMPPEPHALPSDQSMSVEVP